MLGVAFRRRVSLDPIPSGFGGGDPIQLSSSVLWEYSILYCLLHGCIDKVAKECGPPQLQPALGKLSRLNLN